MSLDRAVASAVAGASLLEAALHSTHSWFIEISGRRFPARREIDSMGVTFHATVIDVPGEADTMLLFEGNQLRSAQPFFNPGCADFVVAWGLDVQDLVRG